MHIHPATQRAGTGDWKKSTRAPRHRDQLGELKQVHASSLTQTVRLGDWGMSTQVSATQKDPHKHLPSKFRPAAQGGTREQKRRQWSQGQVGDWQHCSYAESATVKPLETDRPNTAKAGTTAQRRTETLDTPKPTTGHCIALQRDEIQLHQPEHRHKLPQPGKHHRTLTEPHPQGQTPQPRTTTLRTFFKFLIFFFSSYKSHCLFSQHISTITLSPPSH